MPHSTAKGAYPASTWSKNLRRFPTMENLSTTSGINRKEVQPPQVQVNSFIPNPSVEPLADISKCYSNWATLTTDPFVLALVAHGITSDFCNKAICHNITPTCSLNAGGGGGGGGGSGSKCGD